MRLVTIPLEPKESHEWRELARREKLCKRLAKYACQGILLLRVGEGEREKKLGGEVR